LLKPLSEIWISKNKILFSHEEHQAFDIGDIYKGYGSPETNILYLQYIWTDGSNWNNFQNKFNKLNFPEYTLNEPEGNNSVLPQPSQTHSPTELRVRKDFSKNIEVKRISKSKQQKSIKSQKSFYPLEHELNDFDPLEFLGISKENELIKTNNYNAYPSDEESFTDFQAKDAKEIRRIKSKKFYSLRNNKPNSEKVNDGDNTEITTQNSNKNNIARIVLRGEKNKDYKTKEIETTTQNQKSCTINSNNSEGYGGYSRFFDFSDLNSKSKVFAFNKNEDKKDDNSKKSLFSDLKLNTNIEKKEENKNLTFHSDLFKKNSESNVTVNDNSNNLKNNKTTSANEAENINLKFDNIKGKKRLPFIQCNSESTNYQNTNPLIIINNSTNTNVIPSNKNSVKNTPCNDEIKKNNFNKVNNKEILKSPYPLKNDQLMNEDDINPNNIFIGENSNVIHHNITNNYSNVFPFAEYNNENSNFNLFKPNMNSNLFHNNDTMFHSNHIKNLFGYPEESYKDNFNHSSHFKRSLDVNTYDKYDHLNNLNSNHSTDYFNNKFNNNSNNINNNNNNINNNFTEKNNINNKEDKTE